MEEKKIVLEEVYRPAESTREFIFGVYDKFIKWRALRDQPYKQFNNKSAVDYWSESRQKFFGYLPLSYDTDTPQFFFPETRNQIVAILAKIANLKTKPSFQGIEGFDLVKGSLLKNLFEYWRRDPSRKINNFWQYLYNIINGTVIVFTAYNSNKRDVKNVTMYDPATGEIEYNKAEVDDSDVEEVICNLEDIYVPKIWEPSMNKQGEMIWRTLLKWNDFQVQYAKFKNKEYVIPGSQFADTSIFTDFLSYDVRGQDFVEVIKYFNKDKDQYAIIANGVLLNPVRIKDQEEISPLPWNHKELPFSKTIYEPLDANFFYGISLPQKVKDPQTALNRMWQLLLEREQRAVSSPIITNDPSVDYGLEFKAGRVYQIQTDVNQYKELQMAPTSGSYWNALTTLQGIMNRTGQGGAGQMITSQQPRSATEKAQEAAREKESVGLYFLFYQDLLEQKSWLAIQNMIQFYTSNKVEKIIGDKEFNKIITLSETRLVGGGVGNVEIRITGNPSTGEELRKESYLRSLLKKERVEIIEVSPQALRDIKFDIRVDFEQENSPETERALYLDYVATLMKLFGNTGLISPKKMLYRVVEKFNEQIGDVVEDSIVNEYQSERFSNNAPKPSELPAVNNANQAMRGQMFGAAGPGQQMVENGQSPENILKGF